MSITWPALKPHDQIAIIAPSSKLPHTEDPQLLLSQIQEFFAVWELQAVIADNIFGDDLLCANSDAVRFIQLKTALFDPNIKAIWCLRGGYGCTRLLPMLQNLNKAPAQVKPLIGFSDITALHFFLNQIWQWPTIHGPSLKQILSQHYPSADKALLKDVLFGKQSHTTHAPLIPMNDASKQASDIAASRLCGGNLSLVNASLGTPWQIQTAGKILLLEEVNERAYRIDRMLIQLQQAKVFDHISGIIFGDFMHEQDASLIPAILQRFAKTSAFPIYHYAGIGHGLLNRAVALNTQATLQVAQQITLTTHTGCAD